MSRNVRDTNRFVPQLSTVAIEKALPLIPAGKISLKSNHDTVEEEKGYYLLEPERRYTTSGPKRRYTTSGPKIRHTTSRPKEHDIWA